LKRGAHRLACWVENAELCRLTFWEVRLSR